MRGKDPQRVLFFETSMSQNVCRAYDALARFAKSRRWNLQMIECGSADKWLGSNVRKPPSIPEIIGLWQPDGIIINCAGRKPMLPLQEFGSIPIVLLDCPPSFAKRRTCIYCDDSQIAKTAACELLSLGLTHYAYIPYPADTEWSRVRGQEFKRIVEMGGGRVHRLNATGGKMDLGELLRSLAPQLRTLPKPCGIFAVNDQMARQIVSACEMAGITVPNEISVIGVDNDERFCENATVTLSSISVDFAEVGTIAARLLAEAMCDRRRRVASVTCHAVRVVRRMSSRRFPKSDVRVSKALEFIRLHACEGLTPADVAREIGCSRRLMDLRFSQTLGHTVHDELHEARLSRVQELLMTPGRAVTSIPDLCGYGSLTDLCRDFKKRTGLTLRAWRASQERRDPCAEQTVNSATA